MLKRIYLSPIGYIISLIQNIVAIMHKPFMVYGYYNSVQKKFMKYTRISSNTKIMSKQMLDISDNVWIWHHSILDATNGIKIGKGTQIGAWVGIFTHSSHIAIRLLGDKYLTVDNDERIGYVNKDVEIGDYTFIAAGAYILPGVKIGKGCLISSGTVVSKSIPDYSIVLGNPGKIIGDVKKLDAKFYKNKIVQEHYFDKEIIEEYLKGRK